MLPILLIILGFSSSLASAAEIYRWVDERGVTQYAEKPPEGRPSTVINTRPALAPVDSEGRVVEPPKPAIPPPTPVVIAPQAPQYAPPPYPQAAPVRGMEFGVYTMLRRGMTEGEVLVRAGRPDQETVEGGFRYVVKSLYYYPTTADPFITVVTLRGGRVADIERTRKF